MKNRLAKSILLSMVLSGLTFSTVMASNLIIVDEYGGKYLKYNDATQSWGFVDENGGQYDTISHKQNDLSENGADRFLVTNTDHQKIVVLCNNLILKTAENSNIMIETDQDFIGATINLGTADNFIKNIDITAVNRFSHEGLITSRGENSSINIYAENMKIEMQSNGTYFDNPCALISGTVSSDNSSINLNISKKLEIVGDICSGYNDKAAAPWKTINSKNTSVNINNGNYKGTVQIEGEIYTGNCIREDKVYRGNKINISFVDGESYLTGKVFDKYAEIDHKGNESALDSMDKEGTNIVFANGAKWNMTDSSYVSGLNIENGAVVDMAYKSDKYNKDDFRKLVVYNSLTGNGGTINMDIDASKNTDNSDQIFVEGVHSGTHYITLNNASADTDGAEGTVLVSVKNEQGEFKSNDSEGGLYWNKYELGKKTEDVTVGYTADWYLKTAEKVNPDDKPTTSVDTVLSVNNLNYHTWRTENDKLLQRMGELRHNGDEEKGAWFRVKGSKIGRDGGFGFENQYTTYQLGYDEVTKRTEDMVRYQGAALSYTDGSSSYDRGSGDNHSKSISFYSTDQYAKGHYLDLVFKISNMDNDFKVFDTAGEKITGELDNTGVSISAEYGRKNNLSNGWYIEPQAQLTLGYMGGASYETSNNINVEQSGITSAVGRIGFNIGRQVGERGIIYAKANLLHEFGGGYDVEMSDGKDRVTYSDTFNDTWFEYGVGAAFATSKNSHIYFDVERSAGSDFYKDWQWNAGVRWSF